MCCNTRQLAENGYITAILWRHLTNLALRGSKHGARLDLQFAFSSVQSQRAHRRKDMTMPELGQNATVLGASIGGLLAARVLADFYNSVTVVERDVLPDRPVTRRGVPQGGLPHILAPRGTQILGQLFPGFLDELVAGGARVWNDGDLSRLCVSFGGHRLLRSGTIPDPKSVVIYYAHRPFVEWSVRRRVRAVPNVEIVEGHDVVRLTSTKQRDRVTGVVVARRDSGAETTLTADLVVDATGRGSRVPVFLDQLGYRRPREDQLTVHVAYAGLPIHVPPGTLRENIAFAAPEPARWDSRCSPARTTFACSRFRRWRDSNRPPIVPRCSSA
jgi:2-polyprenyl-6-methoxyphenol hydroxylase-like FAD-dependent oxidoreductase